MADGEQVIPPVVWHRARTLFEVDGESLRTIATQLGVGRDSLRRRMRKDDARGRPWKRARRQDEVLERVQQEAVETHVQRLTKMYERHRNTARALNILVAQELGVIAKQPEGQRDVQRLHKLAVILEKGVEIERIGEGLGAPRVAPPLPQEPGDDTWSLHVLEDDDFGDDEDESGLPLLEGTVVQPTAAPATAAQPTEPQGKP